VDDEFGEKQGAPLDGVGGGRAPHGVGVDSRGDAEKRCSRWVTMAVELEAC